MNKEQTINIEKYWYAKYHSERKWKNIFLAVGVILAIIIAVQAYQADKLLTLINL